MVLLKKIIMLLCLIMFHTGSSFSTNVEPDEEDLKLSKKVFLASGLFETQSDNLKQKQKGVLTLCFKQQKGEYDHTALVFERWVGKEVKAYMVHYGRGEDGCCLGNTHMGLFDNHNSTICKMVGGWQHLSDDLKRVSASFTKYASWFISDQDLLKGLKMAESLIDKHDIPSVSYPNCVKYATKIMGECGMTHLDFGWWSTTPNNLKALVRDYIQPSPNIKHY